MRMISCNDAAHIMGDQQKLCCHSSAPVCKKDEQKRLEDQRQQSKGFHTYTESIDFLAADGS